MCSLTTGGKPQLLHHTEGVVDQPRFGDLAVGHPPYTDCRYVYAVAGVSYAHEFALLRAAGGPACDHLVPRRHLVIQTDLQVGEGVDESPDDALYTFRPSFRSRQIRIVEGEIGGEDLVTTSSLRWSYTSST
jgi:hypothetical protein